MILRKLSSFFEEGMCEYSQVAAGSTDTTNSAGSPTLAYNELREKSGLRHDQNSHVEQILKEFKCLFSLTPGARLILSRWLQQNAKLFLIFFKELL
jgi:hypothetical protein